MRKSRSLFEVIAALVALVIFSISSSGLAGAQGLQATYNDQGLATLSYGGVNFVDAVTNVAERFDIAEYERKRADGTVEHHSVWDKGFSTSWNAAQKTLTWRYDWGAVSCKYIDSSDRLNLRLTVTNTTTGDRIDGVDIFPFAMRFPNTPAGFAPDIPQTAFNSDGPTVITADYGQGVAALCNFDVVQPLYCGFFTLAGDTAKYKRYAVWVGSTPLSYQPGNYPKFNRPIAPGKSDTFSLSLRFGPPGTSSQTLAGDIYKSYTQLNPAELNWPDRRAIGYAMLSSTVPHPAGGKNERGWFSDDPNVDVTTESGRERFRAELMTYADVCIQCLKDMNAQGVITWDIEGQQYPHATSYVGDPTMLAQVAPEMEPVADEYFKKFRDAGLRVGVCIRPQQLVVNGQSARQEEVADPVAQLNRKIAYAKKRWDCTLFYVDSNGDPNSPYDAHIFKKVAEANPTCLIIPEHQNTLYYAYTAPVDQLDQGVATTPRKGARRLSALLHRDRRQHGHRDRPALGPAC